MCVLARSGPQLDMPPGAERQRHLPGQRPAGRRGAWWWRSRQSACVEPHLPHPLPPLLPPLLLPPLLLPPPAGATPQGLRRRQRCSGSRRPLPPLQQRRRPASRLPRAPRWRSAPRQGPAAAPAELARPARPAASPLQLPPHRAESPARPPLPWLLSQRQLWMAQLLAGPAWSAPELLPLPWLGCTPPERPRCPLAWLWAAQLLVAALLAAPGVPQLPHLLLPPPQRLPGPSRLQHPAAWQPGRGCSCQPPPLPRLPRPLLPLQWASPRRAAPLARPCCETCSWWQRQQALAPAPADPGCVRGAAIPALQPLLPPQVPARHCNRGAGRPAQRLLQPMAPVACRSCECGAAVRQEALAQAALLPQHQQPAPPDGPCSARQQSCCRAPGPAVGPPGPPAPWASQRPFAEPVSACRPASCGPC